MKIPYILHVRDRIGPEVWLRKFEINYLGDGVNDQDHYCLSRYDMGIKGSPFEVRNADIRATASTLISDAGIQKELRSANCAAGALILDSCERGQALEGGELRGPLDVNASAFSRIDILAADESLGPAAELQELGNSLLTFHCLNSVWTKDELTITRRTDELNRVNSLPTRRRRRSYTGQGFQQ